LLINEQDETFTMQQNHRIYLHAKCMLMLRKETCRVYVYCKEVFVCVYIHMGFLTSPY